MVVSVPQLEYMLLQEIADLKERCKTQGLLEEELQQKDSTISQLQQTINAMEVCLSISYMIFFAIEASCGMS